MVVAILGTSALSQVFLFSAALSNGGPQIERDYYARAVGYDKAQEMRARRDRLGWQVEALPMADALVVRVHDGAGRGVERLTGWVEVQRANRAQAERPVALEPVAGQPGYYRARVSAADGVWDVRIKLDGAGAEHVAPWELRLEPARAR
jgi:nitrogen fixation protein FixH